ncbi:MAG: SAM-dependent methyltransferase [Rhodothermales bacterium]|jgi:SAM-dependent methyltransferase
MNRIPDRCGGCHAVDSRGPWDEVIGQDGAPYGLVRCTICELVAVAPSPSGEFLQAFYEAYDDSSKSKEGVVQWDLRTANRAVLEDYRERLGLVMGYAPGPASPKRVLDVGCSFGFFLSAAKGEGLEAVGVDVDERAMTAGREQLGLDLRKGDVYALDEADLGTFDIATLWMTLEHLAEPLDAIVAMSGLLNKDGLFACSVPNLGGITARLTGRSWRHMIPPEHLNFFTETSMRNLLESAGLEPLFVGSIRLHAAPAFSFATRKRLMDWAHASGSDALQKAARVVQRALTLIKRHVVYGLMNAAILGLGLGGDGLFVVARRCR